MRLRAFWLILLRMNELTTHHYQALLGLDSNWRVTSVEFRPQDRAVDIQIEFCGDEIHCPGCTEVCPRASVKVTIMSR